MRAFLALFITLAALFVAREADAQVHWDVSVEAGVMKRFLASRPTGGKDAGFGPAVQLAAHLALLPLVHVGGYVGHDISPVASAGTRNITFGGFHTKGLIPFFPPLMRGWIYTGFGYAGTYQRSDTPVPGRGGGFFEVPFGFGVSYKLRKPWSVFAELGGRVGFGHSGNVYGPGNAVDRFALGLSVGVMLEL